MKRRIDEKMQISLDLFRPQEGIMKTQHRFAPTSGHINLESVTRLIGIRKYEENNYSRHKNQVI